MFLYDPEPVHRVWRLSTLFLPFFVLLIVPLRPVFGSEVPLVPVVLVDTDSDGIPDASEDPNRDGIVDAGETDPLHVDSDRDGLPDGVEDRNRDGRVGVGETDPRLRDTDRDGVGDGLEVIVTGTDPKVADIGALEARFALLPEPLYFDLVRGLASRAGELEVNSLFSGRPGRAVTWAPEVEYAVADGMALELELPMVEDDIEAIKGALQSRLPLPENQTFIQGAQGIVETQLSDGHTDVTLLWLVAAAPDRTFSFIGMFGTRAPIDGSGIDTPEVILNPSVFARLANRWVVGLEVNGVVRLDQHHQLRLLPQVHWEPINHLRLQFGTGVEMDRESVAPQLAGRIVFEL